MTAKHNDLADLFHHQLKDLHDAERHAGKLLAKMGKVAIGESLRKVLDERHDAAAARSARLDGVFAAIDKKVHDGRCDVLDGLADETKTLMNDFDGGPALDPALISSALAAEHYLLARTTALSGWATQLGHAAVGPALAENLVDLRSSVGRWPSFDAAAPALSEPLTPKRAALLGIG